MSSSLIEAYERRLASFDAGELEEFYSPTQARDKEGQWTKMWSGVSAHPEQRKAPSATNITKQRLVQSPEHIARQIYDADLGNGFSSTVDHHDIESHGAGGFVDTYIGGTINRKDGLKVGYFKRHFYTDDDGKLVANHEELFLDPQYQGRGLADRFNSHAISKYQKYGVDRIELEAAADVGGYAWARQGFRLKTDVVHGVENDEYRRDFLNRQLDRTEVKFRIPVLREHARQLQREVAGLRQAIKAGEDVQPIHLASIGEGYARYTARDVDGREYETWPGKELLLGTQWYGTYYFDANDAVTAAASSLAHADLRPAFREGSPELIRYVTDELIHWHDEFACHDASCRPPKSGGTGGSKSSGGKLASLRTGTVDGTYDGDIAAEVKHQGSLTVARAMTDRERSDIKRELDYTVNDPQPPFSEPFSTAVYMATSSWGSMPKMSVGLAMQLQAVYEKHQDDYKIFDEVAAEIGRYNPNVKGASTELSSNIEKMTGISIESGFVSYMNSRWAHSAHSEESIAMQIVAAGHRNLAGAKASLLKHVGKVDQARAKGLIKKAPNAIVAVFEATYRTTQKALAAEGITEVPLFRGITRRGAEGSKIIAQPSPLSSWTTSPQIGFRFSINGQLYKAPIKAEDIYSLANLSGTGSLSEREVIVLGNKVTAEPYELKPNDEGFADEQLEEVEIDVDDYDWIKRGKTLRAAANHITSSDLCQHGLLDFACHDASCRPPTSGGTGGSRAGRVTGDARHAALVQLQGGDEASLATERTVIRNADHFREIFPKDLTDRIRIRTDPDTLKKIVESGGYLTVHDEGNARGSESSTAGRAAIRIEHEQDMFGEQTRPVYGYVQPNERLGGHTAVAQYGGMAIVLKPEVAERTTVTMGDSLDTNKAPAPVHATEVHTASDLRLDSATTEPDARYIEAQIHGGIKISDIARIEFHSYDGQTEYDRGWDTTQNTTRDWTADEIRSWLPGVPVKVYHNDEDFTA